MFHINEFQEVAKVHFDDRNKSSSLVVFSWCGLLTGKGHKETCDEMGIFYSLVWVVVTWLFTYVENYQPVIKNFVF